MSEKFIFDVFTQVCLDEHFSWSVWTCLLKVCVQFAMAVCVNGHIETVLTLTD